jgi:hypothetical protein
MPNAAFFLMNLDLIAVPLQVNVLGSVTIYCGKRRAAQLASMFPTADQGSYVSGLGFASVARLDSASAEAHTLPCKSTIARNVAPLQSGWPLRMRLTVG